MVQDLSQTSIATVSVHALSCGHFTLPEHQFVKPSTLEARRTVPSLAFLVQHKADSGTVTRILFDLGLRRDLRRYPPPIQKHTENRRPIKTDPDIVQNLARGGLTPDDIDYVVYSHVRERSIQSNFDDGTELNRCTGITSASPATSQTQFSLSATVR
jgi:glyoxylase-like metal-dependent hydrolase (beta-lactamase superfamily II)